jgi:hypothetical protein
MKKYLIILIAMIVLSIPIVNAGNILISKTNDYLIPDPQTGLQQTHTVLGEYGTMTTCGPCVTASSQLYSIYNSGDFEFYYVSLVFDTNYLEVGNRLEELGITAVPHVFFDGLFKNILGGQSTEQTYRNAITQAGQRIVPDLDVNVDVEWNGNAILGITVTVQNNEVDDYNGKIRVYITEIESRWNDAGGNPYHYAVLDIPIDKPLALAANTNIKPLGDTYSFKRTWFGGLHGFNDITQDNILVIAGVFDKETDYAVETAASTPTTSQNYFLLNNLLSLFLLQFFQKLINFIN